VSLLQTTRTTGTVRLNGEIDLAVAEDLTTVLHGAVDSGVTTIDASGITFMDSSGLHVLLKAADASMARSGPLVLVRPSACVRRLFDVALPGGVPSIVLADG
jgi:anti-anti-sigma factor